MKDTWLQHRTRGVGGSDAPAVCGVSPWKSPYQVWMEKRGLADPHEDNEPMFWGRTLEPVIRQRYSDVTGRQVLVPNDVLVHPDIPWMLASVDGIADGGRVLEVKTARTTQGWGEPGSADIPDMYIIQVQHYMVVTHLPVADVAALIGGSDFRLYEIPEDKEMQALIMEREAEFWRMVQENIPPNPVTLADMKQRFGKISKAVRVQASPLVINALERLKEIKALSEEEDSLKAMIMGHLKEADTLMDGDKILATWKASKGSMRFDTKAFQDAHPELYKEFCKQDEPSRRLLIK